MEIWAVLKYLGKDGLAEIVDRTCSHAKYFAKELEKQGFEILNDVVINQIVATTAEEDKLDDFITAVQQSGKTWFGPTNWKGRKAFRISISSHSTTKEDVDISLKSIIDNKL